MREFKIIDLRSEEVELPVTDDSKQDERRTYDGKFK